MLYFGDFDEMCKLREVWLKLGIDCQHLTPVADLSQFLVADALAAVGDLLEVPHEGIIHPGPTTYLDTVWGGGGPFHLSPAAIKGIKRQIADIGLESQKELRIKRLKLEMAEISADQKSIREGHMHLTEKFKEIEFECVQLREESKFISQQRAETNSRLILLLKILQAKEDKDFVKANNLKVSLRELIASQNEKIESNQMTRTSFED